MDLLEYLDLCIVLRDNDYMLRRIGWADNVHYRTQWSDFNEPFQSN